jgi:uncharacterized membrane protein HdeD (DUF308 family)
MAHQHQWAGPFWTPPARGPAGAEELERWIKGLGLAQDEMRSVRRWLLVAGTLSILAGVVAIAVPAAASVATAVFIGWVLVAAGIAMIAHVFSQRSRDRIGLRLLNAALTLFVGIYILAAPLSGTVTLTFMLAVWFFGIGVLELAAAWRERGVPIAEWLGFNGAVSTILGLLIAFDWPSSSAWAIGLLVGINLVIWGLRAIFLAAALRRATGS